MNIVLNKEINLLLKQSEYYKKNISKRNDLSVKVEILSLNKNTLGKYKFNKNEISSNTLCTIKCLGCGKEKEIRFEVLLRGIRLYCWDCGCKNGTKTLKEKYKIEEYPGSKWIDDSEEINTLLENSKYYQKMKEKGINIILETQKNKREKNE